MNSTSQSANSSDTSSHPLADILGTAIALLTLILPLMMIFYYSSPDVQNDQQYLTYYLDKNRNLDVTK